MGDPKRTGKSRRHYRPERGPNSRPNFAPTKLVVKDLFRMIDHLGPSRSPASQNQQRKVNIVGELTLQREVPCRPGHTFTVDDLKKKKEQKVKEDEDAVEGDGEEEEGEEVECEPFVDESYESYCRKVPTTKKRFQEGEEDSSTRYSDRPCQICARERGGGDCNCDVEHPVICPEEEEDEEEEEDDDDLDGLVVEEPATRCVPCVPCVPQKPKCYRKSKLRLVMIDDEDEDEEAKNKKGCPDDFVYKEEADAPDECDEGINDLDHLYDESFFHNRRQLEKLCVRYLRYQSEAPADEDQESDVYLENVSVAEDGTPDIYASRRQGAPRRDYLEMEAYTPEVVRIPHSQVGERGQTTYQCKSSGNSVVVRIEEKVCPRKEVPAEETNADKESFQEPFEEERPRLEEKIKEPCEKRNADVRKQIIRCEAPRVGRKAEQHRPSPPRNNERHLLERQQFDKNVKADEKKDPAKIDIIITLKGNQQDRHGMEEDAEDDDDEEDDMRCRCHAKMNRNCNNAAGENDQTDEEDEDDNDIEEDADEEDDEDDDDDADDDDDDDDDYEEEVDDGFVFNEEDDRATASRDTMEVRTYQSSSEAHLPNRQGSGDTRPNSRVSASVCSAARDGKYNGHGDTPSSESSRGTHPIRSMSDNRSQQGSRFTRESTPLRHIAYNAKENISDMVSNISSYLRPGQDSHPQSRAVESSKNERSANNGDNGRVGDNCGSSVDPQKPSIPIQEKIAQKPARPQRRMENCSRAHGRFGNNSLFSQLPAVQLTGMEFTSPMDSGEDNSGPYCSPVYTEPSQEDEEPLEHLLPPPEPTMYEMEPPRQTVDKTGNNVFDNELLGTVQPMADAEPKPMMAQKVSSRKGNNKVAPRPLAMEESTTNPKEPMMVTATDKKSGPYRYIYNKPEKSAPIKKKQKPVVVHNEPAWQRLNFSPQKQKSPSKRKSPSGGNRWSPPSGAIKGKEHMKKASQEATSQENTATSNKPLKLKKGAPSYMVTTNQTADQLVVNTQMVRAAPTVPEPEPPEPMQTSMAAKPIAPENLIDINDAEHKQMVENLRAEKAEFHQAILSKVASMGLLADRDIEVPRAPPTRYAALSSREEKPFRRTKESPESRERPWPQKPVVPQKPPKAASVSPDRGGSTHTVSNTVNEASPTPRNKADLLRTKVMSFKVQSGGAARPQTSLAYGTSLRKKKVPLTQWETKRPSMKKADLKPKSLKPAQMVYKTEIEKPHQRQDLLSNQPKTKTRDEGDKTSNSREQGGWKVSIFGGLGNEQMVQNTANSIANDVPVSRGENTPHKETSVEKATESKAKNTGNGWLNMFRTFTHGTKKVNNNSYQPDSTGTKSKPTIVATQGPSQLPNDPAEKKQDSSKNGSKAQKAFKGRPGHPTLLNDKNNSNDEDSGEEVFYYAIDYIGDVNCNADVDSQRDSPPQSKVGSKVAVGEAAQSETKSQSSSQSGKRPARQFTAAVNGLQEVYQAGQKVEWALDLLVAWHTVQMATAFLILLSLFCPKLLERWMPYPSCPLFVLRGSSSSLLPAKGIYLPASNSFLYEALILPIRLIITFVNIDLVRPVRSHHCN